MNINKLAGTTNTYHSSESVRCAAGRLGRASKQGRVCEGRAKRRATRHHQSRTKGKQQAARSGKAVQCTGVLLDPCIIAAVPGGGGGKGGEREQVMHLMFSGRVICL